MPRKRKSATTVVDDGASKRAKLLDDNASDSEGQNLQINEDYAKRFRYNKERAELHRLEEKYGKDGDKETDESSSEDETEDEDGELANEVLDDEIAATLKAIQTKDPRIYSQDSKFYTEAEKAERAEEDERAKPMYLRDYHRKNLLENGGQAASDEPMSYVQEQDQLKRTIMKDINAAANGEADAEVQNSDEDDFLVRKEKQSNNRIAERATVPDPRTAEQDPSTFLSNFFAARAWVPTERSQFAPLESDDEDQESEAERLEHAWNLRFEDPSNSNKNLTTHSREIVAKYSVRRDDLSGRKKIREKEKDKKLRKKMEREEERKRFKNLKVRHMEEKMDKIREAAGLRGKHVEIEDWTDLLDGDWNDEDWNKEMSRRFGDDYYEEADDAFEGGESSSSKPRKPRWEDDIDVKDFDPDFESEDGGQDEGDNEDDAVGGMDIDDRKLSAKAQRANEKAAARRDRRIIESIAQQNLPPDLGSASSGNVQSFRYRETSPNTFGLTPLDILAADDSQLNQFAGLKKLATFRDPEWKKNDKKKLSKKARLRAWRKDTFGREEGPDINTIVAPGNLNPPKDDESLAIQQSEGADLDIKSKASKKKRKRKSKGLGVVES